MYFENLPSRGRRGPYPARFMLLSVCKGDLMRQRNLNTQPPTQHSYIEWLRYLVQSSDPYAGELPFLVGLWSYLIKQGGLTDAQMDALQPFIDEADQFLAAYVYPRPAILAEPDMTNVVNLFDRGAR